MTAVQKDTHKWVRTGSSDPASMSQRKTESIYVLFSKKNKSTQEEAAVVEAEPCSNTPMGFGRLWMQGGAEGAASLFV